MGVIFNNKKISKSIIKSDEFKKNKIVFGKDGNFHYIIMSTLLYRMDVIRRIEEIDFTDYIKKLHNNYKVVINGNYFQIPGGRLGYLTATFNTYHPSTVKSVGDIRDDGRTVLSDESGEAHGYFYIGRGKTRNSNSYVWGTGNIPNTAYEGFGGCGPVILTNPGTNKRIKYGSYTLEKGRNKPFIGKPKDWKKCTQRSSTAFREMDNKHSTGIAVAGINRDKDFLVVVTKDDGKNGRLSYVRDRLWDIGVDGAVFMDGSSSVTLAIDKKIVIEPAGYKDSLIEIGLGFYQIGKPYTVKRGDSLWKLSGENNERYHKLVELNKDHKNIKNKHPNTYRKYGHLKPGETIYVLCK